VGNLDKPTNGNHPFPQRGEEASQSKGEKKPTLKEVGMIKKKRVIILGKPIKG